MLAETTDYGRSWHAVRAPHLTVSGGPQSGAEGVSFVNSSVGYLYGRALWVTTDGGARWTRRTPPDPVAQVVAADGTTWAVTDSCRGNEGCPGEHETLYRLGRAGRHWHLIRSARHLDYSARIQTVQGGDVLVSDGGSGLHETVLLHHPGRGWSRHRVPCGYSFVAALITSSSIAVVCGSLPGAGEQPTQAWISTDGGHAWHRRGNPGEAGYITDLAVRYPATWVLVRDRGDVEVSTDSGQHWHIGIPVDPNVRATDGQGWLTVGFTTPTNAIATTADEASSYIATSHDGGRNWRLGKAVLTR